MFDLINGLPVHPLVVHAAVVLIPLTLVGTILIAVRRAWRKTLGWWVVGLAFVSMVAAWVGKESGEALARRIGQPDTHAQLGDTLPYIAGIMFVAVLALVLVDRLADARPADDERMPSDSGDGEEGQHQPALVTVTAIVAVVVCVGATYQTYRVGDTGAQAAWAAKIAATTPVASQPQTTSSAQNGGIGTPSPVPSPASTAGSAPTAGSSARPATKQPTGPATYTMAEVSAHNSAASCWTAINGSVYNLTPWENLHPGGVTPILSLCGTDGTTAFEAQHGGQGSPQAELANYKIGVLG